MTDQELDRLLRRALLDAADQEAQTPGQSIMAVFLTTIR